MDQNKQKALDAALQQIERQFGKGSVMKMGEAAKEAMPAVSTGSLGLDIALGVGGLRKAEAERKQGNSTYEYSGR